MLNPCVTVKFGRILVVTNIYAIRQRIFKCYNMQICHLFVQHSETSDVSHVFLPLTIAELSTLKQVRFFGPPCRLLVGVVRFTIHSGLLFTRRNTRVKHD